jgi:hypothetical protein
MINSIKLVGSEVLHKLNYASPSKSDQHGQILRDIQEKGYHVIEGFLSRPECEALIGKADDFIGNNEDKLKIESNGYDKRIYAIDKHTADFTIPAIDAISEKIFTRFSFIQESSHFMLLNRITGGPDNLGSGSGWHRDSPFSHQFKTILYLNDVADNGPFQFVEGTHRYNSVRKVGKILGKPLNARRFTETEIGAMIKSGELPEPTRFTAPAGSLIIADTRGLHRGSPLLEGVRYALTRYHFSRKSQAFEF